MKNLKPYDNYKPSDVEWLGDVPEHWEVKKAKYLWKEKAELSELGDETLLSVSQYSGVKIMTGNQRSENLIGYKKVNENDLVINIMLAWLGGLGLSSKNGIVSPAYAVYQNIIDFNPKFLHYLYRTKLYLDEFARRSKGVVPSRWRMYTDDFGQVFTLLPPLTEQTKIANYLDRKTAQIDEAIAQKEQLIALLKERQQILIHQAVTQGLPADQREKAGLDDSVEMKDSGVEWIGDVPKHWEVKKLRYLGQCQNGLSKGGEYFGSGFPFVNYSDIYKNEIVPTKVKGLVETTENERRLCSVQKGDVFFTRTSETVEEIGIASTCFETIENATFAGFVIRFRPQKDVLFNGFSKYFFRSKMPRTFFVGEMNLVIRASLSQELLKRLPVLLPPLKEQKVIALFLDENCQKIQTAISLKQQEIEKLKEYKTVLIDAAVTGKVLIDS